MSASTPANALDAAREQTKAWEPHLNAFRETFFDQAEKAAANVDENAPLAGVPVAVKDIISTTEGMTAAASKMLERYQAPFDATVVRRLREAGALIVGKANCDEFAMGASNEYSAYGPVKNPWDLTRVAGGSSGGSIASVAAGEVPLALGTDTGGSIRVPASYCNAVGLKPTYGRVSRFGVIAYASSFDQVGPVAMTVREAASLMEVIAGHDVRDATSADVPVGSCVAACDKDISGMTLGVPTEFFSDVLKDDVRSVIETALQWYEEQGATLKEVSLKLTDAAIPTYYLLVKAEASSNMARFDGIRYGKLETDEANLLEHYVQARGQHFGPEVKRSILMGTYALSAGYVDAWYKQASRVRTLIRREFEQVFEGVDALVGPVTPDVAFPIGEKSDDPLQMYLVDLLTTPASVAGLPAISVPAGFVSLDERNPEPGRGARNLPVGMQLIGPHFGEETLFQLAAAYEQGHDWHAKRPLEPTSS